MIPFFENLGNFILIQSKIRKFGRPLEGHFEYPILQQFECFPYFTQSVDMEKIIFNYDVLINSKISIIKNSDIEVLKTLLISIRHKEFLNCEFSEAEYWYLDLNLLYQLDLENLKNKINKILNFIEKREVLLVVDNIQLYHKLLNNYIWLEEKFEYISNFIETIKTKPNIYILGIKK